MWLLYRRRDEQIQIGEHIRITVIEVRGDKVRLGIEAPPEVAIHRGEVFEAIKREERKDGT